MKVFFLLALCLAACSASVAANQDDDAGCGVSLFIPCHSDFPTATVEDAGAPPLAVYLFAGQSNMLGRAPATPEAILGLPQAAVPFWYSIGTLQNPVDPYAYAWGPLRIASYGTFGPEIGFGRAMRAAGKRVAILKFAEGGTRLAAGPGVDWSPDARGELADQWVEHVGGALLSLHEPFVLRGVFWGQGEQDATDSLMAAAYGENLKRLRAFVGDRIAPLPWACYALHKDSSVTIMPFAATVRAAQVTAGCTLNVDDKALMSDAVHLGADAQLALGERAAEYFLAL